MQEPVFDIFGERSRLASTNVENRKMSKGVMKQKSKSISSFPSTKRVLGDVKNTMQSTCMQKEDIPLLKPTMLKETIKTPVLKLNGEPLNTVTSSVYTPLKFRTSEKKTLKKSNNTFKIKPDLHSFINEKYFDDEIDEYFDIRPEEERLSTEDIYNLTNMWKKPMVPDSDCDLEFNAPALDCDDFCFGNDSDLKTYIFNLPTF